jgi:hypothetical protein
MLRTIPWVVIGLLAMGDARAEDKYAIKQSKAAPPKELKDAVRKLMGEEVIQLIDNKAKGAVVCEVWFRKELPANATDAQIKNGLTYRDNLAQTIVVGAIRFPEEYKDYRKQKIKAGVYTLRLAFQPMDGDHMGTAPNGEFCLLSPAEDDKDAKTMEAKALHELSQKASGTSHPAVLLLYPHENPKDDVKLVAKENDWVLTRKQAVLIDGKKKATIGIALTLVGVSPAVN